MNVLSNKIYFNNCFFHWIVVLYWLYFGIASFGIRNSWRNVENLWFGILFAKNCIWKIVNDDVLTYDNAAYKYDCHPHERVGEPYLIEYKYGNENVDNKADTAERYYRRLDCNLYLQFVYFILNFRHYLNLYNYNRNHQIYSISF